MKKSKVIVSYVGIAVLLFSAFAFTLSKKEEHGLVKWVSFEEAVKACNKAPKPIIVDIYTTWCGPCKLLSKNTFGNEHIAKYMNDKFYCVRFDAETRDTVKFTMMVPDTVKKAGKVVKIGKKPQEYKFYNTFPATASRSTHQFAASILQGQQIAFPSIVFLSKTVTKLDVIQGYYPPEQFEPIVKYFGSGSWETTKYEEYQKSFKSELNSQSPKKQ